MGYGTSILKINLGVRTLTLKNDWLEITIKLNDKNKDTTYSNRVK